MNLLRLAADALTRALATAKKSYVGLNYEPATVSTNATVQTVQASLRAAENGDTRQLFALYRDLTLGGSHIQCEFGKRKMAVLSQPHSILPFDKENQDDLAAAAAVTQAISDCENWSDGLAHLLDATLWPVAAVEKLYRPADRAPDARANSAGPVLQYTLKRLHVVNPTLLCFRRPYGAPGSRPAASMYQRAGQEPGAPADTWEPDLRFHATDPEGRVDYSWDTAYPADPMRHIIHRGHLLPGVRDNWGGPMRSIVFWWLLSVLGRDWFARAMERYGSPFPVGKTDATNADAVQLLQDAFSLSTKIGGMVVDNDTQIELIEAMTTGLADAHEKFIDICNREISKVIIGQELSATAKATGLGSGTSDLQGKVREDIRAFDQMRLAETLARQLFDDFLRINGLVGRVKIVWGGLDSEEAKEVADLLVSLNTAGLEPTDEAIPTISDRVGFQLQRKEPPEPTMGAVARFNSQFSILNSQFPRPVDPTDKIAARKAAALGQAYRGAHAPIVTIILNSATPEEALRNMGAFYSDWKPEKVNQLTEEALQIAAAAGAAAASSPSPGGEGRGEDGPHKAIPPLTLTVNVTPSRTKKLIPARDTRGLITHFDAIDTTTTDNHNPP